MKILLSYYGLEMRRGMLDNVTVRLSWAREIVKFALNPGSSQHGKAVLAKLGSNADATIHLLRRKFRFHFWVYFALVLVAKK